MIKTKIFINNSPKTPTYFEQDMKSVPRQGEFLHYEEKYYLIDTVIYVFNQDVDVEINVKSTEQDPRRKRVQEEFGAVKLGFG